MGRRHHVFLVPGFFGFANLGRLVYFAQVRELLGPLLARRGVDAVLHRVHTHPTASLAQRARRLAEVMAAEAPDPAEPLHVIGHSTGGLDARHVVAPGVDLGLDVEPVAARVRSVVTVAAPHLGTPLAGTLLGAAGVPLLRVLSLATVDVVRKGRLSLHAARQLVRLVAALGDANGAAASVADQLFDELLRDFDPERRAQVAAFFAEVAADRSLIPQLRPDFAARWSAGLPDRPGVRRGSVVVRARPPRLLPGVAELGFDAYAQAMHGVFRWLHRASGFPPEQAPPPLAPEVIARLEAAYGDVPGAPASDGIVPTRSQPWGELIHVTWGDHLDVIGHFSGPDHAPPHLDWLPSGSRFRRAGFEALWADVADFLAAA